MLVVTSHQHEVICHGGGSMKRHLSRPLIPPDEFALSPVHADDHSGVSAHVEQITDDRWRCNQKRLQWHVTKLFADLQINDSQMLITSRKERERIGNARRAIDAVVGLKLPDFLAILRQAVKITVMRCQQQLVFKQCDATRYLRTTGEHPALLSRRSFQCMQNAIFITDVDHRFRNQRSCFESSRKLLRIRVFNRTILPDLLPGLEIETVQITAQGWREDMFTNNGDSSHPAVR